MKKVKICGIRRQVDVDYVNAFRPDYVGFIFAKSRRQITPEMAKKLSCLLDKNIKKVGIFVNEDVEEVKRIADFCGLDIVQLHGEETRDDVRVLKNSPGMKVWKAFRIRSSEDLGVMETFNADGYLLDAFNKKAYGGTGEVFDWKMLSDLKCDKELILAGGINEENIEEALKIEGIDTLDISSGVETGGFKDKEKIRKIIEKVRSYENK
ncbi:MAG: phosphoribosylanthranilate isomerase [Eubacteriaceae bacterium]|nr:phosphoribosylanthranilate isomerase [Eubacteriaceae bacterium]